MLPSRARIRNFRSIEDLTIQFVPTCLVLLGINETGKSNILRALSLLSPAVTASVDDVRQVGSSEELPSESSVCFEFDISTTQADELARLLSNRFLGPSDAAVAIVNSHDASARMVVGTFAMTLSYVVDVGARLRGPVPPKIGEDALVAPGWLVPTSSCPAAYEVTLSSGDTVRPKHYHAVHLSALPEGFPTEFFEPFALPQLDAALSVACSAFLGDRLPECILRSFTTDDGLPSAVNIDEFVANPATSPALYNMFRLAQVGEPREAFKVARTRANGVRTMLERVAGYGTRYVCSVWKEFSDLRIELYENGSLLECVVRDVKGSYSFSRRSDGFRRFVSFLLQVSSRMSARDLEGAFLLYDEPDTSLHPSGARQLRDELVRLSSKNIVVYSTHSIFMVDPGVLERHLVVSRLDEVTSVEQARPSIGTCQRV